MNKGLPFPLVPQRIAVISSETAAGYGDFLNQLETNSFGYCFFTELFPAIMQGDKASESIILALEHVYSHIDEFDLVAIMRGGGSKSDLNCFDDYELAYFITQFPLPILTGIGHERDDTVTDIVAHTKLKTPTAVAEFLIEKVADFDNQIDEYGMLVTNLAEQYISSSAYRLEKLTQRVQTASVELLQNKQEHIIWAKSKVINGTRLLNLKKERHLANLKLGFQNTVKSTINHEVKLVDLKQLRLKKWLNHYFITKERRLVFLTEKAKLVNPERILERGYAWVTHKGAIVKDASKLKIGDAIEVKLAKGRVEADVAQVKNE
jgi:exodeoxyribonuclease VII large subunit